MYRVSIIFLCIVSAVFSLSGGEQTQTLQFSDPSKPCRLELQLGSGDVTIVGVDGNDVTIQAVFPERAEPEARKDGLRRLDVDGSYSVAEADNVIRLVLDGTDRREDRSGVALMISLPRSTSVSVDRIVPGETIVRGLSGEIDIRGAGGSVTLEDVSGGALVETPSGEVSATLVSVPEKKPISITAISGDVSLQIPASAKASLRFRTLRGEILTDFSEDELISQFENASVLGEKLIAAQVKTEVARVKVDIDRGVEKQVRGAAEQARTVAEQRRMERATLRKEARTETQALRAESRTDAVEPVAPVAAVKPTPAADPKPVLSVGRKRIPPMSGGKLVTGTINGGGTEILITTMTGNITLRKTP